MLHPEP